MIGCDVIGCDVIGCDVIGCDVIGGDVHVHSNYLVAPSCTSAIS